jgi:hypothetical protein
MEDEEFPKQWRAAAVQHQVSNEAGSNFDPSKDYVDPPSICNGVMNKIHDLLHLQPFSSLSS